MFKVASINQGGASREMIYGYARVSTANQRLDRQVRSIEQWAGERRIEKIYREKYTGTTIDRPQFSRLLSIIKSGDTIVFDSVSRMSRTAMEGFELYMALLNKGVDLVFCKEMHINTEYYKKMQAKQLEIVKTGNASADDLINTVLAALTKFQNEQLQEQILIAFQQAEKEVTDLHKRISEGIATTKQNNAALPLEQQKRIGRRTGEKIETKRAKDMKEKMRRHLKYYDGSMMDKEFMEAYRLSRKTFYKYKKQLREEDNNGMSYFYNIK